MGRLKPAPTRQFTEAGPYETAYAPAALREALRGRAADAAARRRPPTGARRGAGTAFRRASSNSIACSNVTESGFMLFGTDALVVPSVTYGPYRPASSLMVVPLLVSSFNVFFCEACRRRDCFGARKSANACSNEMLNTSSSDSSE